MFLFCCRSFSSSFRSSFFSSRSSCFSIISFWTWVVANAHTCTHGKVKHEKAIQNKQIWNLVLSLWWQKAVFVLQNSDTIVCLAFPSPRFVLSWSSSPSWLTLFWSGHIKICLQLEPEFIKIQNFKASLRDEFLELSDACELIVFYYRPWIAVFRFVFAHMLLVLCVCAFAFQKALSKT